MVSQSGREYDLNTFIAGASAEPWLNKKHRKISFQSEEKICRGEKEAILR
jgi:hypothetical protein